MLLNELVVLEKAGKIKEMGAAEAFQHYLKMKKMFDAGVGGMTQAGLAKLKQTADEALEQEIEKSEQALKSQHGSEWLDLAKKMYPITTDDGGFVVTSKVRDWKGEKRLDGTGSPWQFSDKVQAEWKVQQLIKWLEQNRKRSIGDADSDIASWLKKLDAVDQKPHA